MHGDARCLPGVEREDTPAGAQKRWQKVAKGWGGVINAVHSRIFKTESKTVSS